MNNILPRETTKMVYCFDEETQHELEDLRKDSGENETIFKMTEHKSRQKQHYERQVL